MREIRTSGLMSGERKRATASRPRTAPFLDSTCPTIRFEILYVFVVLAHERRQIVHFAVTAHPTAEWTAQQLREAFPWDSAPQYLLRDRDRIFGQEFVDQVKAMGTKQVLSAPRSPWQRAYVARLIGSIRRECLDHIIVFGERSLVVPSPRMFRITTAGALICRSAKTPRNSDEHRPAPKVTWSKFVKSVVYTIITNARPPK